MVPASNKEFLDIQANYRVWIHSETVTSHDNNIQLHMLLAIILQESELIHRILYL